MLSDLLTWLAALPPWQMFAGFWVLGVVRGLGYYGLGAAAGSRVRAARWQQARDTVQRLGVRSVVVTWPVYGLAGATQVANGAARVPLAPFVAALVPLAATWAVLQTVVGVVLLEALMSEAAPYLLAVLAIGVGLRLALSQRRRRSEVVEAGV